MAHRIHAPPRPYRPWFMIPLGIIVMCIAMAVCSGCMCAAPPSCYQACPQASCQPCPPRYSEPQMPYVNTDGRTMLMPKSAYGPWIRDAPASNSPTNSE